MLKLCYAKKAFIKNITLKRFNIYIIFNIIDLKYLINYYLCGVHHLFIRKELWRWVLILLFEKRLLTLFLGYLELRNFYINVKNDATVDALCVCIFFTLWQNIVTGCCVSIYAWGFYVARFTLMGNAKASDSETSNGYWLSRFFLYLHI